MLSEWHIKGIWNFKDLICIAKLTFVLLYDAKAGRAEEFYVENLSCKVLN